MLLAGKAAIVTGGGTGVGRATALELARQGCSVLINYSRSRDDAEVEEHGRSIAIDFDDGTRATHLDFQSSQIESDLHGAQLPGAHRVRDRIAIFAQPEQRPGHHPEPDHPQRRHDEHPAARPAIREHRRERNGDDVGLRRAATIARIACRRV